MRRTALLLPLALALLSAESFAAGLLLPRSGEAPIEIKSHRVTASIEDGLARTTVRQTFVNQHQGALEAIYLFPLPEGSALVDVAMEVGGQRLEGLLAERKRARRVYNSIVRSRRDPALVEQIGRAKFRLSVFPVLPGQDTIVEFTYLQRIPVARGEIQYVYPLALGGPKSETKQDLTFVLSVKSSVPLEALRSSSPDVAIARRSAREFVASLEKTGASLSEDIVVTGELGEPESTLSVKTWRGEAGDGYFLAVITPPPVPEDQIIPRDVILVLDTSGSMKGEKIVQAKASALYLLENLRATDRVNVLLFSSDVRSFAEAPVPATAENLAKLKAFVTPVEAGGGTAIADALTAALDVAKVEGRVRTVVFLTDGRPTIGAKDPAEIVKIAKTGGERGLRVFPFGVGSDLDGGLLRGIAQASRGRAELFRPGGEIESRVRRFLDRTSAPVIADLTLDARAAGLTDVFPRPLPDLYLGEQLAIVGRYREGGERKVALSATVGDRPAEIAAMADFRTQPGGSPAVRDLFARMKLEFLERNLRLRAGLSDDAYFAALDRGAYSTEDEITAEMIAVSTDHGVQCPYTSWIVLLPEDRHRIDPRDAEALSAAMQRTRESRDRLAPELAEKREQPRPVAKKGGAKPVEDPVIKDGKVVDHNETDNDLPFEESLGMDDFISDAPFDGPSTNASIGIGGGAGGSFGGRGGHRNLRAEGGGKRTESSVDLGLEWLNAHQQADGSWESATGGPANTGFALLAFLGAGETHKHGRYKRTVKNGAKYLKTIQGPKGCFGPEDRPGHLFDHAVSALAMSEMFALTASPLFKQSAQTAIDFLHGSRDSTGTWGEDATVWAVLALKSAKMGGLRVDQALFDDAVRFLDRAENRRGEAIARIFCGEDPRKSELVRTGIDAGLKRLEAGNLDTMTWHLDTLAMFQAGGEAWKKWNAAMKTALIDSQRKDGAEKGSWDPHGKDAARLGRVGTTALYAMCKEVYYRYARVFGTR